MSYGYSDQQWFCNNCGREMLSPPCSALGGKYLGYRVCSSECVKNIRWKDTLSLMNQPYKPRAKDDEA